MEALQPVLFMTCLLALAAGMVALHFGRRA